MNGWRLHGAADLMAVTACSTLRWMRILYIWVKMKLKFCLLEVFWSVKRLLLLDTTRRWNVFLLTSPRHEIRCFILHENGLFPWWNVEGFTARDHISRPPCQRHLGYFVAVQALCQKCDIWLWNSCSVFGPRSRFLVNTKCLFHAGNPPVMDLTSASGAFSEEASPTWELWRTQTCLILSAVSVRWNEHPSFRLL